MRFLFTSLLISLISFVSLAQHNDASLSTYEKLCAVNAEWLKHPEMATELNSYELFNSDDELIQQHLLLVIETLRSKDVSTLNDEALAQRNQLLDELYDYALAGIFPRNTYHQQRTPYFIDDYGTACAVGYMMIQAGDQDVAEQIHQSDNYAYIAELDMKYPELQSWASSNGFTVDELAWIQPGYPVPTHWHAMEGTTGGTILDYAYDPVNDMLYAAGDFTGIGGESISCVARWDGSNWHQVGDALSGEVRSIEYHDGSLYIGGNVSIGSSAAEGIATIDIGGSSWTVWSGMADVYDIHFVDDVLYCAYSGFLPGVARYNSGSGWETVISADGFVYALADYNGKLYAGGSFFNVNTQPAKHIVAINTDSLTISQVDSGLQTTVHAMASYEGVLYVGSEMYYNASTDLIGGLMQWSDLGWVQYESVRPISTTGIGQGVLYMKEMQGELLMAGDFSYGAMVGYYGNSLASVGSWGTIQPLMTGLDTTATAIAAYGDDKYASGHFSYTSDGNSSNMIRTALELSNPGFEEAKALSIYPNPATYEVSITTAEQSSGILQIYNAAGQVVKQMEANGSKTIELAGWPKGYYNCQYKAANGSTYTGSFIKQ